MGRRALVAYGRGDGRYDLHRSRWAGSDPSVAGRLSGPTADPVAPDPVASGVDPGTILREHLDPPLDEALYVLDGDGESRAYRLLWPGPPVAEDAALLVSVRWAEPCDDARIRAWFDGARGVAAAAVERGSLRPAAAAALIARELRGWAGDRAVLWVPRRPGR